MKTYRIRIFSNGALVYSGKCRAMSFKDAQDMAELLAQPGDQVRIS